MASASTTAGTDWLTPLLVDGTSTTTLPNGALDAVGVNAPAGGTSRRFDGWYGRAYSAVMREPMLRRPLFGMLGDAGTVSNLDMLVQRIACETSTSDAPLLDVPCGQGVVAELLATARWTGRLVAVDLAHNAVARTGDLAQRIAPQIDARVLRADALALPLRDDTAAGAVSINGLHVMPDHAAFLAELARVVQPGGSVWLVTIVAAEGKRSELLVKGALKLGVASVEPPTRAQLDELASGAGLEVADDFGTGSFTALRLVHT